MVGMMVGSLFSGIGGFDLGLERAGMEITFQVECDDYCRQVLKKHWPAVPCHYDIRTIDWQFIQPVDLICGGFPCQPFSLAGQRRGADDDRYLWPEVVRCVAALRPAWCVLENVPGLIGLGLDQVLADLEGLGYETQTLCIPACAVDAHHRRDRLWIFANTESDLRRTSGHDRSETPHGSDSPMADAENANGWRTGGAQNTGRRNQKARGRCSEIGRTWPVEPDVGRVVARVPAWMDGGGLDGTSQSGGTREILQALQCGDGKKAIQWPVRGFGSLQTPELLLTTLREYEGPPKALGNVSLAGSATSPIIMRGVWFNGQTACASCRSKAREQRSIKPSDLVRLLSQLLTCDCGSTRLDPSGTPTKNRVDRLRGLGNAIVPAIPEIIGKMILEIDRDLREMR